MLLQSLMEIVQAEADSLQTELLSRIIGASQLYCMTPKYYFRASRRDFFCYEEYVVQVLKRKKHKCGTEYIDVQVIDMLTLANRWNGPFLAKHINIQYITLKEGF